MSLNSFVWSWSVLEMEPLYEALALLQIKVEVNE